MVNCKTGKSDTKASLAANRSEWIVSDSVYTEAQTCQTKREAWIGDAGASLPAGCVSGLHAKDWRQRKESDLHPIRIIGCPTC